MCVFMLLGCNDAMFCLKVFTIILGLYFCYNSVYDVTDICAYVRIVLFLVLI